MQKIEHLDLLRGYAAISVVFYHYLYHFNNVTNAGVGIFVFAVGKLGVALFFILSGYLISLSIRNKTPSRFLFLRFLRLIPTYYLCIILTFGTVSLLNVNIRDVDYFDFISNFFIFPSLFNAKFVDGSYWTLEYEWIFYTVAALCLFTKSFFIYTMYFILLFLSFVSFNFSDKFNFLFLNNYSSFFLLGVCFFSINQRSTNNKIVVFNYLVLSLAVVSLFHNQKYFLIHIIIIIIFLLGLKGKLNFLDNSMFRFFSKISYPLYLLHQYIGFAIILFLLERGFSFYFAVMIAFFIAVALSYLVHLYIEIRLSAFLKRFYK
ncbi:acyltransferase [Paraglaciecola sp.]|uniref:acyltransferase family protein n=1 Tax=Paraglaciecola sp. TaxID=1920173 RepID=UPI00273F1F2A|nr:acyltransferase [Paraglaciecola sp.]MDP5030887.1 acyltransferase [Paraglaciecola sp.]